MPSLRDGYAVWLEYATHIYKHKTHYCTYMQLSTCLTEVTNTNNQKGRTMRLLKRIAHIFSGRVINKIFRFMGLALLITLCFIPSMETKAAEIDPDAVWENIAAINGRLDNLEIDINTFSERYENLDQLIESHIFENETIAQKLDFTNDLLQYLISVIEAQIDNEIISNEENLKFIVETSATNTAAITGSISENTILLEKIDARQSEDITNKELMETLSGHLVDVSGNTLELSNSVKSENSMSGLIVAACILFVSAIAIAVIIKALRKQGYCREFCNLILDKNLEYCWGLVFARDEEEKRKRASTYEWQEVTKDSGCPFYPSAAT